MKEDSNQTNQPIKEKYFSSDFNGFLYSRRPLIEAKNTRKSERYAPAIKLSYDFSETKYRLKLGAVDKIRRLYRNWKKETADKTLLVKSDLTGSAGKFKGFFHGVTLGMLKESLNSLKEIVLDKDNWEEVSKGKRDDF